MTKSISVIEKKIIPLVQDAQDLKIVDEASMKSGVELLSKMNQIIDKVTEEKEKVTKPLNQALKAERARWSPVEKAYEVGVQEIREKMSAYQTAQVKAMNDETAKIAARVGDGKGKFKIETAVKKIEAVPQAQKEVATAAGLVQFRETPTLKIVDAKLIPAAYLVIDEKKVMADLKAGIEVPGAVIEIIQTPVNYR